ncbi:acyl carrier protein [Erysipelothrix aquatica]|uniref:acyl carrier protein n=1 Tax=Erysipelothrix aquatica TaxID=2683714 RepID=UPI00135C38F4|nr:acyl carrier protein [Erysipelothrix aquatica]
MEQLQQILMDINPTVDFDKETRLVDERILDSLSILALVTEIEAEFDVEISPMDLVPENFNSKTALWNLVCRLRDDA